VSELQRGTAISDGENVGVGCSQVVVHLHALLINFNTCCLEADILNVRSSSGSDQDSFYLHTFLNAILSVFDTDDWERAFFSGGSDKFKADGH